MRCVSVWIPIASFWNEHIERTHLPNSGESLYLFVFLWVELWKYVQLLLLLFLRISILFGLSTQIEMFNLIFMVRTRHILTWWPKKHVCHMKKTMHRHSAFLSTRSNSNPFGGVNIKTFAIKGCDGKFFMNSFGSWIHLLFNRDTMKNECDDQHA